MEALTVLYILFTTILILIHWQGLADPLSMATTRAIMLGALGTCYGLYRIYPCRALRLLRVFPPLLGLIFWYPETYDFCSQYPYLAHVFAATDQGIFPAVGYYFQTHTDMLRPEIKGIFSQLVSGAQEVGERPTAAFPSSHVGMSTVTMMLAWKARNRWLFWVMVPVYLLLCCATVYIQAHYLIDSIFGLISAVLFFMLTSWGYKKLRE